ncbi:hypothetical protein FB451DRAFT_1559987 [Mycena latifolia]|nr:hypothetical protein FB451DRAFT_1559987 [Mycena latifolia]
MDHPETPPTRNPLLSDAGLDEYLPFFAQAVCAIESLVVVWQCIHFQDRYLTQLEGEEDNRLDVSVVHTCLIRHLASPGQQQHPLSIVDQTPGARGHATLSKGGLYELGHLLHFFMQPGSTMNLKEILDGAGGTPADLACLCVKHFDALTASVRAGSIAEEGRIEAIYFVAQVIVKKIGTADVFARHGLTKALTKLVVAQRKLAAKERIPHRTPTSTVLYPRRSDASPIYGVARNATTGIIAPPHVNSPIGYQASTSEYAKVSDEIDDMSAKNHAFLRYILRHDCMKHKRVIFMLQSAFLQEFEEPFYTEFDYRTEKVNRRPRTGRITVRYPGRMQRHVVLLNRGNAPGYVLFPVPSDSSVLWDGLTTLVDQVPEDDDLAPNDYAQALRALAEEQVDDVVELH